MVISQEAPPTSNLQVEPRTPDARCAPLPCIDQRNALTGRLDRLGPWHALLSLTSRPLTGVGDPCLFRRAWPRGSSKAESTADSFICPRREWADLRNILHLDLGPQSYFVQRVPAGGPSRSWLAPPLPLAWDLSVYFSPSTAW